METITSPQNPKIKNLKRLEKAGERKEQNLILIEGLREVVLAHRAGYEIGSLFVCNELLQESKDYPLSEIRNSQSAIRNYEISKAVYDSLAYRETTEGIIATARPKDVLLQNLKLKQDALVLEIEGGEKPGNLGEIGRE